MVPSVLFHSIDLADHTTCPDWARCSCGWKSKRSANRKLLRVWSTRHLCDALEAVLTAEEETEANG